ncbi:hypothetical protein SDC9_122634 [bioreactor metagenome]|uniref:Uncharacterized protein n=1 Tax=bioreactor metagenome TaxID=1076179 RepID=A0A645CFE1_9ZZZZ
MIYGDEPTKWNERKADSNDRLGLNAYTYLPDMATIRQSGNLYVYALSNPVVYIDWNGEAVTVYEFAISAGLGAYGKGYYGIAIDDEGNVLEYYGGGFGGGFGLSGGVSTYTFEDMETVDEFEEASLTGSFGVGLLFAGAGIEVAGDSYAVSGSVGASPPVKIGNTTIKVALGAYATVNKSVTKSKHKVNERGEPFEFHRWS